MNQHTVSAFDTELTQLRALIAQMGGLAEQAIAASVETLKRHDLDGARRLIDEDRRIDALETQVDQLAVQMIALRAPMADDLREVVAALKIAGLIERIGDYAKNIAKRVPAVDSQGEIEPLSVLPAMAGLAVDMVRDVLDAFAARDADAALAVCERDRELDDFYNSLFRTLVTYMMENPKSISQSAHLLFVAKNLERVGDHATNIAEEVFFAATGTRMVERERDQAVATV